MKRRIGQVGILCLVFLWSGCASRPDQMQALGHLKAESATQLFQEARQALWRGELREASVLLERFLVRHPQSSLRHEARWWLAWSYRETGNLEKALEEYRQLAESPTRHPYREQADRRVTEIQESLGWTALESPTVHGMLIPPRFVREWGVNRQSLKFLAQTSRSGVNTFILDVGCLVPADASALPVADISSMRGGEPFIFEDVERFVTAAHRRRQRVLVSLDLRCLGQVNPKMAWRDGVFDPVQGRARPSLFFDLFHRGYQSFVKTWLANMSQSGIDGMIFQTHAPFGPFEGFTRAASRGFSEMFQESLDPKRLFHFRYASQVERVAHRTIQLPSDQEVFRPAFWRWTGWKARERLRVLEDIAQGLRRRFPHLTFGLEISRLSLEDPLQGLIYHSEDWVAIGKSRFDFFYLSPEQAEDSRGARSSADIAQDIAQMVQFLEDPRKVWVRISDHAPPVQRAGVRQWKGGVNGILPQGVGRIVRNHPLP